MACITGRYTPAISRMEEPEMPGSTMAVMATAPARNRYAASGICRCAMSTVSRPELVRSMVRDTTTAAPSRAKGKSCQRRRALFSASATKGMEATVRPSSATHSTPATPKMTKCTGVSGVIWLFHASSLS